jgi:hypothetical protein
MDELGLIDGLKVASAPAADGGDVRRRTVRIADLSRLNVKYPFIAFMPQWIFNFSARERCGSLPLRVMMSTEGGRSPRRRPRRGRKARRRMA